MTKLTIFINGHFHAVELPDDTPFVLEYSRRGKFANRISGKFSQLAKKFEKNKEKMEGVHTLEFNGTNYLFGYFWVHIDRFDISADSWEHVQL